MSKPNLTVERLITAEFHDVGCWQVDPELRLSHSIILPRKPGVYAFAIDDVVQYIGLASKSLHQRLNFYRRPGASQRTNIRLNSLILRHIEKGAVVRVLIAHPPDQEWNGLILKGPEGIEAGLIAMFDLPWNMRGTGAVPKAGLVPPSEGRTKNFRSFAEQILDLVTRRPGMTELEIAKVIHGPLGIQQQTNPICRKLVESGSLLRRGRGGATDPFTYYPAQ